MTAKNARTNRPVLEVHLDAPELGPALHIGNLFPAVERVDLAPSFEYTQAWIDAPAAVPKTRGCRCMRASSILRTAEVLAFFPTARRTDGAGC